MKTFLFSLILLFGLNMLSFAAISDTEAVRTILGEASNQGFDGMVAVGEVIRRRKTLKGIYGFKACHVDKEPELVWVLARKAWETSKASNLTKGATHFENVSAFGRPRWALGMVETIRIKDHVFFKEA